MNITTTLEAAVRLITTCGSKNTFILQGEPGIGKSAMLGLDWQPLIPVYIDSALMDLGDFQMPVPTEARDFIQFVPNKIFCPEVGVPVVVMLDEIGKANRMVQNALLTLLHEHRIGNYKLPEGSIVFGTTNLVSDGVGDMMQAHAKNRVTFVTVRKPNAEAWIPWGINHGVEPEVLAWVKEYPQCLDSYTDYSGEDNPYIYNPKKVQDAFVTPRSLFNASNIVKNREALGDSTMLAALVGTIGQSAAMDMKAYITVADSLPSWDVIINSPETCPVPESPIACTICAMSAVSRLKSRTMDAWMKYLERLPLEVQHLFANHAMSCESKADMVMQNEEFTGWTRRNSWAL